MKTKLGLIVLIIIIGLVSVANLSALRSDYKKKQPISGELVDKIFKRFARYYGIDAQHGKERINFKVYDADEPKYKDYKTYIAFWGPFSSPYKSRENVICFVKNGKVFIMNEDFGNLIKEEKIKVDSTNILEIFKLNLELTRREKYKILKIKKVKKSFPMDQRNEFPNEEMYNEYRTFLEKPEVYFYEILVRLEDGNLFKFNIGIEKGHLIYRCEILETKNMKYGKKGRIYKGKMTYRARSKNIKLFNAYYDSLDFVEDYHHSEKFYKDNNIILKQNSIYNISSATVTVRLSGFTSNESTLIWFKSISEDGTVKYYPENPILFTTNFWGNAEQDITFPDTLFTGKYKVYQVGNEYETERYFFIYETITSPLPNTTNYNSRIFFCDQFKDFNHNAINNLAENIKLKFNDVFNTEINEWNFPSPKDIDPDENLDIYVIDDHYDNCIPKVFL